MESSFCFMIIYDYIYYHLHELVSKIRKMNSRESTLLYLTIILFFITSPFIVILISSILKYAESQLVFMILSLGYGFVIYFLNKKYFERKNKLNEIMQKFKDENLLQRRFGYIIVILLLLSSFPLFFLFLSLF